MNHRIVLIDDDSLTNYVHHALLSRALPGVDIHPFTRGSEALSYLRLNAFRDDMEHLILLDINMPEMSGWEVLKAIESTLPEIRAEVAVLTSSIDEADRKRALSQSRVISFVSKPLDQSKLNLILNERSHRKQRVQAGNA